MKSLYIAGRITGDENYREKFLSAQEKLAARGYRVFNPVTLVTSHGWNHQMREALRIMLSCDGVALLPDWRESKGAVIEARLAYELGIPAKPLSVWLE